MPEETDSCCQKPSFFHYLLSQVWVSCSLASTALIYEYKVKKLGNSLILCLLNRLIGLVSYLEHMILPVMSCGPS